MPPRASQSGKPDTVAAPASSSTGDVPLDCEASDPFACFHPVTAEWFKAVFDSPTAPQRLGWPVIARGESALILAPTGYRKNAHSFPLVSRPAHAARRIRAKEGLQDRLHLSA